MVLVVLKSCSLPFHSRQHEQNISAGHPAGSLWGWKWGEELVNE